MKYLLFPCFLSVLAYSAAIANQPEPVAQNKPVITNKLVDAIRKEVADQIVKQRMNEIINEMKPCETSMDQKKKHHSLCAPCKFIFKEVMKDLEGLESISVAALKPSIDAVCSKFVGEVPFLDKACNTITELALKELVTWLQSEENKLDPERVCIFLHQC